MKENIFFETIKCDDFSVFNLQYHKNRISKTINMNLNINEYIYPTNNKLLKCKLTYNDYEILSIEYNEYKKRKINSFMLVYDDNIIYNKKSINRENIDNLFKKRASCDEIIIVKNNYITDTSIANIAIYYEKQWICTKEPLLFGTTLKRYIENEILIPKNITVDMLKSASKIALLNAMIDFDIITKYTIKDTNEST